MALVQPAFVSYDEKDREAYLSQVGNFSPNERSIFHRLCRIWENIIPYNRLIAMLSRELPNATGELMRLMTKLNTAHMGIITTSVKEGKRQSEGIVICEPGDKIYFNFLIQEEILDVFENLLLPLPSVQSMAEKDQIIPDDVLKQASFQDAAAMVLNKEVAEFAVLKIDHPDGSPYLVNQGSLTRYLTIAITKIRSMFQSGSALALGAGLLEMSLSELKAKLAAKEPGFWKLLTATFLEQKANLLAQRKVKLPRDIFDVCAYINNYLKAQLEVAKAKRASEEERKADMALAADLVRAADGYMLSSNELDDHMQSMKEKYGKSYGTFMEDFKSRYMETERNRNLPVILSIEEMFIHQDNIHKLFKQRLENLSQDLYKYYIPIMFRYIKNPQSPAAEVFHTTASFEADIEQQVAERDELMAYFLSKPSTVAEALIMSSRNNGNMGSVDDMKGVLVGYFYPDKVKYKELQVLFNLNVKNLYEHAFLNLSIIRQLILRISGRHESYLKKFLDQSQTIYRRMESEGALAGSLPGGRGDTEALGQSRRDTKDRQLNTGRRSRRDRKLSQGRNIPLAKARGRNSQTVTETPKPVPKKGYSVQERDDAWQEFSKSLKK